MADELSSQQIQERLLGFKRLKRSVLRNQYLTKIIERNEILTIISLVISILVGVVLIILKELNLNVNVLATLNIIGGSITGISGLAAILSNVYNSIYGSEQNDDIYSEIKVEDVERNFGNVNNLDEIDINAITERNEKLQEIKSLQIFWIVVIYCIIIIFIVFGISNYNNTSSIAFAVELIFVGIIGLWYAIPKYTLLKNPISPNKIFFLLFFPGLLLSGFIRFKK